MGTGQDTPTDWLSDWRLGTSVGKAALSSLTRFFFFFMCFFFLSFCHIVCLCLPVAPANANVGRGMRRLSPRGKAVPLLLHIARL